MSPQSVTGAARLAAVPEEPIPAVGYIRVSMAREEMISPELQRAAISDWAARRNRRIVAWIEDLDKTGRNFRRRVQRAIAMIEDGTAKEIAVWKFSRFGRQRVGWAVNLDRVESAGGDLQSATEEVDARTAAGRFSRGMLAEVAAFESDRASEQWKEALQHRRDVDGLPPQGTPRFGYDRKGRIPVPGKPNHFIRDASDPKGERYEPNPTTGPVLASLYTRFVDGYSGHYLVQWLNRKGFRTVRGNTWTQQSLYLYLDSGFGAGLLRSHRRDCRCKQPGRCENAVYHKGAHEPVIDQETWERYLARRKKQRKLPPRAQSAVYPTSGLMRCGHAGQNGIPQHGLSAQHGMGVPGYAYVCKFSIQGRGCPGVWVRRVDVEKAVRAELSKWAGDIDEQARVTQARKAVQLAARTDRERIGRELLRIDKALGRLVKERALDSDMPEAIYAAARQELLDERKELEAALEAAGEEELANRQDHVPVIRTLLEEWDTIAVTRKRDLLATLIRHVKVYRTGVRTPARIVVTPVWEPDTDEAPDGQAPDAAHIDVRDQEE
jgi:DNA invertase Pin-like site-specific DNA recombinase